MEHIDEGLVEIAIKHARLAALTSYLRIDMSTIDYNVNNTKTNQTRPL